MRRALVVGGTGVVGREVVRGLVGAGIPTAFTYRSRADAAAELVAALSEGDGGDSAVAVDLRDVSEIRTLFADLDDRGALPDVLIHCAGIGDSTPLVEVTDAMWDATYEVNARSAFVACQELARRAPGVVDIVLVGALDRAQTLPLPVPFAATQGMLITLTTALAKELGPAGSRINLLALGVLSDGLSRAINPALVADYKSFSALRRLGDPADAARAALWLALENRYMNGKVVPANGGI